MPKDYDAIPGLGETRARKTTSGSSHASLRPERPNRPAPISERAPRAGARASSARSERERASSEDSGRGRVSSASSSRDAGAGRARDLAAPRGRDTSVPRTRDTAAPRAQGAGAQGSAARAGSARDERRIAPMHPVDGYTAHQMSSDYLPRPSAGAKGGRKPFLPDRKSERGTYENSGNLALEPELAERLRVHREQRQQAQKTKRRTGRSSERAKARLMGQTRHEDDEYVYPDEYDAPARPGIKETVRQWLAHKPKYTPVPRDQQRAINERKQQKNRQTVALILKSALLICCSCAVLALMLQYLRLQSQIAIIGREDHEISLALRKQMNENEEMNATMRLADKYDLFEKAEALGMYYADPIQIRRIELPPMPPEAEASGENGAASQSGAPEAAQGTGEVTGETAMPNAPFTQGAATGAVPGTTGGESGIADTRRDD